MDLALAQAYHRAAAAVKPRCWCGCAEAAHGRRRDAHRPCARCGPRGCPRYLSHRYQGPSVTEAHRQSRYLSDLRVRTNLEILAGLARVRPVEIVVPLPRTPFSPAELLRGPAGHSPS